MEGGVEIEHQQAQYDQEGPRTARGGGPPTSRPSPSANTAMEGAAAVISSRLLPKETEIQAYTDVLPALRRWLQDQDKLFLFAEQKTGLDREKLFYIAVAVTSVYLIIGSAAGLLCNMIGFAYPAYQSVIAIRTEQKDDDTQWLVYWTTFASFSMIDFFAEQIYHIMPLYWLLKAAFLLYLALPQTQGAHNMYVKYVDPGFDALTNHLPLPANNSNNKRPQQTTMAQVPPGDITTVPATKIFFNSPFDDKHTYYMKIINSGGHRIGFAFKTTNPQRLNMDPPNGVLDPKESINIAISCDAFDAATEATNNDRVTVEWTNTPEGAAKQFRREWFQGDGMVCRKNLPIEYNM